jgi:hypothetical protein
MFKQKEKQRKFKIWIVLFGMMLILAPAIWIGLVKYEGDKPVVSLDPVPEYVGSKTTITGYLIDRKSGIRKLRVGLRQKDREVVLMEQDYVSGADAPTLTLHEVPLSIEIDARALDINDGPATVSISVRDRSWRQWFEGNQTDIDIDIMIDTRPPQIEVLTTSHNIYQGGAGLVIYRLSEDCETSGVYVGDSFFPGRLYSPDRDGVYVAFIAVAGHQGRDTQMYVHAADRAGNTSRRGFYYRILGRTFKTDTLTITETFLNTKLPEFHGFEDWPGEGTLLDQFLFVNRTLREKNNALILGLGGQSASEMFWQGAFGRLPNSAQQAGFADHRLYRYNGEIIDEATHLGIDLASVQQAPVPAANAGRILKVDYIGIYGNTVIIDHGFGLFSLYSHLSNALVGPGDMVAKGDIIGHTGISGWAGGDHLHFSMIVDHVFVNPVEWWDPAWIQNHVMDKLDTLVSEPTF